MKARILELDHPLKIIKAFHYFLVSSESLKLNALFIFDIVVMADNCFFCNMDCHHSSIRTKLKYIEIILQLDASLIIIIRQFIDKYAFKIKTNIF